MERDETHEELVELGTASGDTRGVPAGTRPETGGFYALGLSDE